MEFDGKKVDCYFGVELEASFTQTPSGLDAWGHDIIFEFTGDDDFWLYVDGELVLDLGGIHSAVPGSVNFRTGEVNENGTIMTLRQVFERNCRARNPGASDADVAAYLARFFDEDSTVFKDDTNHTMRIFCMERGAGASNLCMRFNLAAVGKGGAQLSKTLTGAEGTDVLAEYPYQIYYKYKDAAEGEEGEEAEELEARLTNGKRNEYGKIENYVFYKDTVTPVKYRDTLTIDGIVYEDVFFLKPGQTADISFPEGTTSYRIVECGVNTEVYRSVAVNGTELTGEPADESGKRADYGIEYDTTDRRPKVNYENEVEPDALRTLTIQKRLYREDGVTEIGYDENQTEFAFRLELGTEYSDLEAANMHTYYVKDPDGYYCRWDFAGKKFARITDGSGNGYDTFDAMSRAQKESTAFNTGIYGSIEKIPPQFTVEIRSLLAGTQFKVTERSGEIPDGYSFQRYVYNGNNSDAEEDVGVGGIIASDADSHVIVTTSRAGPWPSFGAEDAQPNKRTIPPPRSGPDHDRGIFVWGGGRCAAEGEIRSEKNGLS